MSSEITLICEACDVCQAVVPVRLNKNDFKPSITGVSTVVDIHGLDDQVPNGKEPHVRILYVDERMSVRSYSVVKALAKRK